MLITNGLIYTDECRFCRGSIFTQGNTISAIFPEGHSLPTDSRIIDARGCFVIPGLTDVHFHGCAGHDFCEGTPEAFDAIAAFAFRHGITSICPATMTLPEARLTEILLAAAAYRHAPHPAGRAALAGIHMEGPFLNPEKCGAQDPANLQAPSPATIRKWQDAAQGLVRVMTIAPELEGAADCIRECAGMLRFSLGHTACSYETAMQAFAAGADRVTHLYNAMPPFGHRAPGLIGAAFDAGNVFAELICDGVHVSGSAVRAAFRLFGADRIVLISDSMEATGMPDGTYQLGGQTVHVQGSRATLADGTLAGSVTPLDACLRTAVSMRIPLEDALRAATINPCRSIGIADRSGSLTPGKPAQIVLLDQETLEIRQVLCGN